MTSVWPLRQSRSWHIAPLAGLVVSVALLAVLMKGLGRDTSYIPSALIGKAAPDFSLPALGNGRDLVRLPDYRGKTLVINFWASWCSACAIEHPVLVEAAARFASRPDIAFLGIDHRDTAPAAARFQQKYGAFPYRNATDADGRVGIDFGVYGLPETFFIDRNGRVVARHVGPLTVDVLTANLKKAEALP